MKPFVFLDLAVFEGNERMPIEQFWHPHSGIATVTVVLDGAIRVLETTGTDETLRAGSVEWMRAGNGVWHSGQAHPGHVKAFQLWVALPPELENGPSQSRFVMPDDVPADGRVRVILGTYDGMTSPIEAPPMMTYLVVTLKEGERWTFTPPEGHDVAWIAISDGSVRTANTVVGDGEVAIFENGSEAIELVADAEARFVIGSARQHPHDLVLGYYSVHTSAAALEKGEGEIARIGRELRASGTLRR